MSGGPVISKDRAWAWGEGRVLGGAGKYNSQEAAWPRKLERGPGAVPPRTETLDAILGVMGARGGLGAGPHHEHIRS